MMNKAKHITAPHSMKKPCPILALIVPCYNESEIIAMSMQTIHHKLESLKTRKIIDIQSFVIYVDDGSKDSTLEIMEANLHNSNVIIKLSSNRGHQNALIAGLEYAYNQCDCAISIDGDLEQDIHKIDEFIGHYMQGSEVVFGVRQDRNTDSAFKKITALGFYKFMNIFGVNIIKNHADYRLLSNKAIGFLREYKESNLFLRGIILELGLRHSIVIFEVKARQMGKSKYTLKKMLSLALNGITSFSIAPLRIIFILGFVISILSVFLGVYGVLVAIFSDNVVPGWASIVVPIYFLGGIQMLSLGIIGEYIGKTYQEAKHRPRYCIESIIDKRSQNSLDSQTLNGGG